MIHIDNWTGVLRCEIIFQTICCRCGDEVLRFLLMRMGQIVQRRWNIYRGAISKLLYCYHWYCTLNIYQGTISTWFTFIFILIIKIIINWVTIFIIKVEIVEIYILNKWEKVEKQTKIHLHIQITQIQLYYLDKKLYWNSLSVHLWLQNIDLATSLHFIWREITNSIWGFKIRKPNLPKHFFHSPKIDIVYD